MKKRYISPQSDIIESTPMQDFLVLSLGIDNSLHPGIIGDAPRHKDLLEEEEDGDDLDELSDDEERA